MRGIGTGSKSSVIGFGLFVAVSGLVLAGTAANAQSRGGTRTLTCHFMIGGVPDRDPSIMTLRGNMMYGAGGQIVSTPTLRMIGTSVDNGRRKRSWAKHVPTRDGVVRHVYWEDRNGKPRLAFSERYDFTRQRIVDTKTGEDSCYHNAYRRR